MLPHFPKAHKEMTELRNKQMFDALFSVSPILSQIPSRPQREGRSSSFQDEQGKIKEIDYKLISVPIQRKLEDARGMTLQEFVETAREPGTGVGKEMMRGLFEMLDKVTQETGNVVNCGGKPIDSTSFLDLLDKVQIDFTPEGIPHWPSFCSGSTMQAQLQEQFPKWLVDPAFQTRLAKIVERKREEFFERETCRRLVD